MIALEKPIFAAYLYPHRSLDRAGYLILAIGSLFIFGLYGLVFLWIGAWPIFGFLGAEWLLFFWLFSRHWRGDLRAERLALYGDRLLIERQDAQGRRSLIEMQPYWLRVEIAKAAGFGEALILRSHGRRLEIGAFLAEGEKRDLAASLTEALAAGRRTRFA